MNVLDGIIQTNDAHFLLCMHVIQRSESVTVESSMIVDILHDGWTVASEAFRKVVQLCIGC